MQSLEQIKEESRNILDNCLIYNLKHDIMEKMLDHFIENPDIFDVSFPVDRYAGHMINYKKDDYNDTRSDLEAVLRGFAEAYANVDLKQAEEFYLKNQKINSKRS